MAVVAAGALALAGCTSDSGTADKTTEKKTTTSSDAGADNTGASTGDSAGATGGGSAAAGDTAKKDLGDVTTKDDTVSFSSGAEEYNAYNGGTSATNSTYNSVVNNQLSSGFWYWGTDGTVYPNEWYGSYEKTSDDPLTVEYTISDDAKWSDGTPITANDYLLEWASTNPDALFAAEGDAAGSTADDAAATSAPAEEEPAANSGKFDPVSDWSTYAVDIPQAEAGGKTFTVTYAEPYPDWEIAVNGALPSHVAAKQAGMTGDELAQAILDGDGETVNKVADFWNKGWLFKNYQVEDESLVPSAGPYTLEGASWQSGTQLTLVPNESFFGPAPATRELMFRFAAPETHVQGLLNGDINVIDPQATVDTKTQLEGAGEEIKVETGDSMTWEHLDFNHTDKSPFKDLAAREAFALCVPRQDIVDNLIKPINPEAQVMNLRERFPFQEDYDEILTAAYDGRYDTVNIDEAKKKFAEAGLKEGQKIRIGYSAPNQRRTEEISSIKASCDQVGFDIQDTGSKTFFEDGGALSSGDWDVALFAWAGSGQIASGKPIYETGGSQNFGGFSNAEVDAAWKTLASSVDPEVHKEQTKIIEKLLWDNLYGIPVFAHPSVVGYDATLENVRDTAVQTGVSWNAEQWVRAN